MSTGPFLSREQVRSVDRRAIEQFGIPGIVLMENAGRGAADLLREQGIAGQVVICAGKGNNGGDGFVIARHLEAAGIEVQVLLFCGPDSLTGDADVNYRILEKSGTPVTVILDRKEDLDRLKSLLDPAEWIVDALLGTGIQAEVRSPFDGMIAAINRAGKRVFAVDLPSGLDCDTGEPLGECVQANLTGTFVAAKQGFSNPQSVAYTGTIHVLPIGVPGKLLAELD